MRWMRSSLFLQSRLLKERRGSSGQPRVLGPEASVPEVPDGGLRAREGRVEDDGGDDVHRHPPHAPRNPQAQRAIRVQRPKCDS